MRAPAVFAVTALATMSISAALWAENVAFIVTNTEYEELARAPGPGDELTESLEAVGFRVVAVNDAGPREIAESLASEAAALEAGDRLVIALSGHFVTGALDAWLLGPAAGSPTPFDVGAMAVPVGAFLDTAARLPGEALVLVSASDRDFQVGPGLSFGFEAKDVPQGVTLLTGPPRQVTEILRDRVLGGTETLAALAGDLPRGFSAHGFLPASRFFTEQAGRTASPAGDAGATSEQAAWATAAILDTEAGYARYLEQHPAGPNAAAARDRLSELRGSDDVMTPERVEDDLALDRATRQSLQRDLSILGYDTRGIDGIFGPGTRSAIAEWQRARDFQSTGFLTGSQIVRLEEQADARAAELEAEAAARRAEQEELDRSTWNEASATDTEEAYRRYLERFPDGLFTAEAGTRLAEFEAAAAEEAAADERAAWTSAREADSIEGYRRYLEAYPQGEFAGAAQARIAELRGPSQQEQATARQLESQIIFNDAIALLAENQLRAQGISPGRIDGRFDEETRRAIRQFQRARGLSVTGYIDQQTAIQLLARSGR